MKLVKLATLLFLLALASTALKAQSVTLTSHNNADQLAGNVDTFTWTDVSDEYWIEVGSAIGLKNYFDSGSLGSANAVTANGLPADNASDVFLRLWWRDNGQRWQFLDYQFTAGGTIAAKIQITAPLPPAMLATSPTLQWNDPSASHSYWVYAGSTKGKQDYYNSGLIGRGNTSDVLSGLPGDSSPVWIRLWYRAYYNAPWQYIDADYTIPPTLLPADQSTLTGPDQIFSFNDSNGIGVVEWWLYVGTALGGRDVLDTGSISTGSSGSATLNNISQYGSPLYVRLWYRTATNGPWAYIDQSYSQVPNQPTVIISEFVASNQSGLSDHTGDTADWIELHNTSETPVNLSGWTLSDGSDTHVFVDTVIGADEYFVLFASGDPERTIAGELHVDFRLSSGGESLVLTDNTGTVSTPSWMSDYPAQRPDISYGVDSNGDEFFFNPPTPGMPNSNGFIDFVEPVLFSLNHGFYQTPQTVVLSTETPEASIRYTIDGSTPTASNGMSVLSGASVTVDTTLIIRAVATRPGWQTSPSESRSYLFAADIVSRSEATPTGWPADNAVNGIRTFYGMDNNLTSAERTAAEIALTAIPSISITTDLDNLFNPNTGIWANPLSRGESWERPAAIELIDPTGAEPGFEINGGLRIKGGGSRDARNFKHSMRLVFDNEYGDGELDYPIHGPNGVDTFESLDLKTAQSWSWNGVSTPFVGRGTDATWLRDVWNRDTQGAMGHLHTRSKYVHTFINGRYWGLYYTEERTSNQFASQYLGGEESDYDVIKQDETQAGAVEARAGTVDDWISMWPMVQDHMLDDTEWARFQNEINVENLADFYLLMWVAGDSDSTPRFTLERSNNWLAVRDRTGTGLGGKWHFVDKDSESALCTNVQPERAPDWNPTPPWNLDASLGFGVPDEYHLTPAWLMEAALTRPEFAQIFRDRVQLHMLTPGGALTVNESIARLDNRLPTVNLAIDAEAARWGNTWKEPGFDRTDWEPATQTIRNCFALRTSVMLNYLAEDGLVP